MVLKILTKLINFYRNYKNIAIFKSVNCHIGEIFIGPEINREFTIIHPANLSVGKGTVLNGKCVINALGGVSIGCYCHIAVGLTIYSHNHNYHSKEYVPYDDTEIFRSVLIGDAVWIGANVTLTPGAKIGHGAVISAGAVVFGEVPDCAIVRGNPSKVIGYRNVDLFWDMHQKGKFH